MKSRLAMMAMLVVGLLMSGTGAGLAVSELSRDASVNQYGTAQPVPCDRNGDGTVDATEDLNGSAPGCEKGDQGVLPTTTTSPPPSTPAATTPAADDTPSCDANGDGVISPSEAAANGCGGVQGDADESAPSAAAPEADAEPRPTTREQAAQPARQVAASGKRSLPFTGFAAVPILLGGMLLLAGGLVLRRRTAE